MTTTTPTIPAPSPRRLPGGGSWLTVPDYPGYAVDRRLNVLGRRGEILAPSKRGRTRARHRYKVRRADGRWVSVTAGGLRRSAERAVLAELAADDRLFVSVFALRGQAAGLAARLAEAERDAIRAANLAAKRDRPRPTRAEDAASNSEACRAMLAEWRKGARR